MEKRIQELLPTSLDQEQSFPLSNILTDQEKEEAIQWVNKIIASV